MNHWLEYEEGDLKKGAVNRWKENAEDRVTKNYCICQGSTTVDDTIINIMMIIVFIMSNNGGRQECFQNFNRKKPLGRPWRRWEDNIRMDLRELGINTRNWVDSALERDYWWPL